MKNLILIAITLSALLIMFAGCANDNVGAEGVATMQSVTTEPTEIVETTEVVEEEVVEEETEKIMYFSEEDVIALAKVLYAECGAVPSTIEKACVAWTACNHVDAGYGDTIYSVLTIPYHFAYIENNIVTDELYNLALDVLTRWNDEKNGIENVGRVLPPEYLYFHGDGLRNYFRNNYYGDCDIWDYSLPNPYND